MRRGSGHRMAGGRRGAPAPLAIEGYTDLVEVGAGTSATVYRAFQEAFQRQVALKLLTADIRDQRAQKRFVSERAMTGRLSRHPNVITVYDSGFAAGRRPYLAMEYFDRGSYANVIDAGGPLPVNEALRVGVKIAGALESAHRAGVIHRDIKPQNILLSGYGEPVLADFGLAIALDPEASFTAGLTPAHAAPELLEGSLPTVATDIYALGSTLYALLAGRGPFTGPVGEGLLAQFRRIAIGDVPDIPRGDLPPTVMAVLRRALATVPTDRFRTAAEFGRALQQEQTALGLPVTELVLEAETAIAPTSRSIVDTRSMEETATRAAAYAPLAAPAPPVAPAPPADPAPVPPIAPAPEAPPIPVRMPVPMSSTVSPPPDGSTLLGRQPVPAPRPPEHRSRKPAIALGGLGLLVVAGAVVGLAASGVLGGGTDSATPKPPVLPSARASTGASPAPSSTPTPAVTASVAPSLSPSPAASAAPQSNSAPTGITATATGDQVQLSWRDHTGGTAPYLIDASTDGAAYVPVSAPNRGTTSAVVMPKTPTTPTCWEVIVVITSTDIQRGTPVCINGGVAPPPVTPTP